MQHAEVERGPRLLWAIDDIAVNPVAKRLGVDWNTANKWLTRYVKTYGKV